jgi:hypothetical protein
MYAEIILVEEMFDLAVSRTNRRHYRSLLASPRWRRVGSQIFCRDDQDESPRCGLAPHRKSALEEGDPEPYGQVRRPEHLQHVYDALNVSRRRSCTPWLSAAESLRSQKATGAEGCAQVSPRVSEPSWRYRLLKRSKLTDSRLLTRSLAARSEPPENAPSTFRPTKMRAAHFRAIRAPRGNRNSRRAHRRRPRARDHSSRLRGPRLR